MRFEELNLNELDKNLSETQRKEWNAIYASYRSGSLLTGRISGVESVSIPVYNNKTKQTERHAILCLVIISYRVKILIPEYEVWINEASARPSHVLRSMTGAMIDYVITEIDREHDCCIASRREALIIHRKTFSKFLSFSDRIITINILAVGRTRLLASFMGFDFSLSGRDCSYAMIPDLRDRYHASNQVKAILKGYDREKQIVKVSVKEAEPHPFDGAEMRHPLNSRRASVITGKYKGGVFCKLEENLDCMCIYSAAQYDEDFRIGDQVIVAITKYNYEKKQVYGKIVAKW